MAVSEKKVTGKFYRIWSAADKLWHRISFWTHANDVEFNDGKTAQTKVGAIKGITTSTSATETGYAADATTVAALNQSLSDKNWKQKTSTTTRKDWYRLSGDYIEEIGFIDFNSIDISVNLGYTYYNKGQPYGLVLSNKFSEIYTVQIQPMCNSTIMTSTIATIDVPRGVAKYWLGAATSGKFNLTIMYHVFGKK